MGEDRAIAKAREELETAEATILSWYRDLAEGADEAGTHIIPVFMAVARSVHRAAAMLEVVGTTPPARPPFTELLHGAGDEDPDPPF